MYICNSLENSYILDHTWGNQTASWPYMIQHNTKGQQKVSVLGRCRKLHNLLHKFIYLLLLFFKTFQGNSKVLQPVIYWHVYFFISNKVRCSWADYDLHDLRESLCFSNLADWKRRVERRFAVLQNFTKGSLRFWVAAAVNGGF